MKNYNLKNLLFRKAKSTDANCIWEILQHAIERRRKEGSNQWQDGYPNLDILKTDISLGYGFVLEIDGKIATYAALVFNNEPAYQKINGNWLTNNDFLVVHRLAISEEFLGLGLTIKLFEIIENYAKEHNTFSIKVDTNFDNLAMLHILKKLEFQYCGEVYFRGSPRKAFEKVLL